MHLSSVVLPQPDGPTTQTNSFSSIPKLIEPIAWVASSPSPYVLPSCETSSIVPLVQPSALALAPRCQASTRRSTSMKIRFSA